MVTVFEIKDNKHFHKLFLSVLIDIIWDVNLTGRAFSLFYKGFKCKLVQFNWHTGASEVSCCLISFAFHSHSEIWKNYYNF
jgi:hypothetical protein